MVVNVIVIAATISEAQVGLMNPSFEDTPADATVPSGWHACNERSTPDILPGFWGVYDEASSGQTYLGLIVRSDGSVESVGQRLYQSLPANECYSFTFHSAHSITYAGYDDFIKLRVWMGTAKCQRSRLIFESDYIEHRDWKRYTVSFTTNIDDRYIVLETYSPKDRGTVMGNVLIDHISPFRPCNRARNWKKTTTKPRL